MKLVKPMTLGLMHRPYRWRGRHRLLVATLQCFALGGRAEHLLRDNLQWRRIMDALPKGRPLDELMPKQRGEVLLAGNAHAAGGLATTQMTVRLCLGGIDKSIRVLGDRQWMYSLLPLLQVTAPAPFTSMPLDWSRAFGGPRHPGNPLGRGYLPNRMAAVVGRNHGPMPNLERPEQPVRGHARAYAPAGFGPLDVGWAPRREGIGTYDAAWHAHSFPGLADDTDPEFFNCAPLDQRIEGHFRGGEAYRLEGMHPLRPVIEGWLPELRSRAFVHRKGEAADAVEEIPLRFDTVWFFPGHELGVALHRGEIGIEDSMALDVDALMVAYERQVQTPRPLSHYGEVLALRMNRDSAARHVFNEAQLTPEPDAAAAQARLREEQAEQVERCRRRQDREAAMREEFERSGGLPGAPPENPDPVRIDAPSQASVRRGDFELGPLIDSAKHIADEARERGEHMRAEAKQQLEALPAHAPPQAESVDEALARARGGDDPAETLAGLADGKADPAQLRDLGRRARLASPTPAAPKRPLQPQAAAALGQWLLQRVREGQSVHGCDLAGADLRGAGLSGADLRGVLLEQADLRGARLDGADLGEAVLTGALLDEADCSETRFDGANLAQTRAHGTCFRGARFGNVQATGSDWHGSDLAAARFGRWLATNIALESANLEGSALDDCVLLHAHGPGSRWVRSRWSRSVALGSDFRDSDWSEANLTRSVLMECTLSDSRWHAATLHRVQGGGGADWSRTDLQRVDARLSSWRGATLAAADLSDGGFRECDFGDARLDGATLQHAVFYRSLFTGCRLLGSQASSADFYQAICRRADFRDADLHGANFVQADCNEAHFGDACLEDVRIEPGRSLPR